MFKNMKLGAKIAAGFSALILIALALGGLAVIKMKGVVTESTLLADEYMPEASLSSDLERRTYRTMYAVRGYNFTGEKKYLDEGRAAIAQVKETLAAAEKLAGSAVHLTKLKESVDDVKKTIAEYERLTNETEKKVIENEINATGMIDDATEYMNTAHAFLQDEEEAIQKEISGDASVEMLKDRLKKIKLINDLIDEGNAARIANLMARANRKMQIMADGIKTVFPKIEKIAQELEPLARTTANKEQLKEIVTQGNNYKAAMEKYLKAAEELDALNSSRVTVGTHALELARNLMKAAVDQTHQIADRASDSLNSASTTVEFGLGAALVIGILMAFFITRSITLPIRKVIDGLNEGADQVASAAGQVSSASQSLAEGSSEQASSIEETSASLEEMSSMTKQNAENAGQANALMSETKQVVGQANDSMGQLTTSMSDISRASEETFKIIKTIDEIAFQTNLLALNAAVEAARAGEAGAGFAVVADEVRNLAMRAAEAAKNTSTLIEGTVKKVKDGSELVSRTNDAFQQVATRSSKVGELVGEIAAASSEQAQGIEQVNLAVTEMDKVTQQNAATAEESASASEELSAQAEQMKSMVNELVAMVGGAGSTNGNGNGHRIALGMHQNPKALGALVPKKKRPALSMAGKNEVRPGQLIPMDDDELSNF